MNRRLLIVSPYFPPLNVPDLQRVRMSLPYFREFGWDAAVLTVDPRRVPGPREPGLMSALPADIPVHRCGTLPVRLTRLAGLGSLGLRSWPHLRAAGARLLRDGGFDLVFFSTTQFITCTLGAVWKRRFGTPFVIDLQDPWRTDYYARPGAPRPPGGWKNRFSRWQADRFEEPSFRPAAGFVSVSANYLQQLDTRYPWFAGVPAETIPFGAPEADFELARNDPALEPGFVREPGRAHLVSVGAAGPIMAAALRELFAGLRAFRHARPDAAARLRLHFIGTSYAPAARAELSVQPLAAAAGVADMVTEQPARIGYLASLKTMLAADALLLLGSDDPGYSPSKIAPYFLAGRPVLALVPPGGAAEARLDELRFARIVRLATPEAAATLGDFFNALADDPARLERAGRNTALFTSQSTARAGTRRLCEFFDRTLSAAKAPPHV